MMGVHRNWRDDAQDASVAGLVEISGWPVEMTWASYLSLSFVMHGQMTASRREQRRALSIIDACMEIVIRVASSLNAVTDVQRTLPWSAAYTQNVRRWFA